MSTVQCAVFPGLRESEALAVLRDYGGKLHYLRVERDFLDGERLPVSVICVDEATKAHLVELPHEAETGARRMWIRHGDIKEVGK